MGPRPATQAAPEFEFSGGALCLDFVNTVGDRPLCTADKLASYGHLLSWSRQAGLLAHEEQRRLERRAVLRPDQAGAAFRRAVELREALYRIFSALAANRRPAAPALGTLNRTLAEALAFLRVEGDPERGYDWVWRGPAGRLDRLLWPVARSAAELLTSSEASLVRECASGRCSWLFVDRSRTRRRRWCDMRTCGNREKARRHYERVKRRT